MFTVCPKCGLMLVVTAADLRAAQGHVRCGRCRSVFNALDSLSETSPQETPPPASDTPQPRDARDERPADHEPEAAEADTPQDDWVEPEEAEPEQDAEATEAPLPSQDGPERTQAPSEHPEPHAPDTSAASCELELDGEPEVADESPVPTGFELEPARERRSGPWLAGALVLVLVLTGQVVNHYRGTLAAMPSVGPTVRSFYGVLGIPIVPLWNVHAYEARQLGATVSGSNPHQITVRASIANRGPWPLPLPLLRVTLQDRYGRTIAARDVPPRVYLSSGSAPAMLQPGRRIDATVAFVNPGPQAVGFEIDACLREGAAVACAHGPR